MAPSGGTMFLSILALLTYGAVAEVAPRALMRTERLSSKPEQIRSGEDAVPMHPAGPEQKEDPEAASQVLSASPAAEGLATSKSESKAAPGGKEPAALPSVAPPEDSSHEEAPPTEVECSSASFDRMYTSIEPSVGLLLAKHAELKASKAQVFSSILKLEKDSNRMGELKALKEQNFPHILQKQAAELEAKEAFANIKAQLDSCCEASLCLKFGGAYGGYCEREQGCQPSPTNSAAAEAWLKTDQSWSRANGALRKGLHQVQTKMRPLARQLSRERKKDQKKQAAQQRRAEIRSR